MPLNCSSNKTAPEHEEEGEFIRDIIEFHVRPVSLSIFTLVHNGNPGGN